MSTSFHRLIGDQAPARIVAQLDGVTIDGESFVKVDVEGEPLTVAAARDLVAALNDFIAEAAA